MVLAFGAWLRIPHLLTEQSGVVFGASYVDVHARMPAYRLLVVAALVGAGLAVYQAFAARLVPIIWAVALYVDVALGGSVYAGVIQRFVVAPNEQVRETPYIVNNIRATRDAFGLDRVEERSLSGDARLSQGRPRTQRSDDRERPAVERSAAARYVRPDSGDPDLLRLRLGRQRPLHHQRQVPADHARRRAS